MANLILWSCLNRNHAPIRPIGCYQLASWLRQHGYTVKVIDFCHQMTPVELAEITEKHIGSETLAIGVSSTFWNEYSRTAWESREPDWVLDARMLLSTRVKIPWLLGGAKSPYITEKLDWIKIHGFAEDSLLKWMDENSNRLVRRNLFDVKNICNSFMIDDFIQPSEVLPIELGRGCQFKCKFCSYELTGKKRGTYLRDFNLIKEEFLRNYEQWGTTKYYFQDDTVNESEEKMIALANIVQGLPFKLRWVGYNRLDLIGTRPGSALVLKDSGLISTLFGIESFHPHAARVVGKGWNGKYGKDFLLKLKEEWKGDINWMCTFIAGLPGEDRTSIEETNQWCIDNKMYGWDLFPLYINTTRPEGSPSSEFDRTYKDYGYSFKDIKTNNWENDIWTYKEASDLAEDITIKNRQYQYPTINLLASLTGLGYSFEELMHIPTDKLPWAEFMERNKVMVKNYIDFQLR